MSTLKERALEYHTLDGVPGKISVVATKPCATADDLGLAYTPGVAEPVLEIENNPENAYKYTSKGNLVGVISNGTAILGLGNRGALASKPVMEGKGVLFKRFADIDVFDIEIDETDPDKFIEIVKSMQPTFGEITKKDIKKIKVVVNGSGAAGISCAKMFIAAGVKKENLIICDSKGVIYTGRPVGMTKEKKELANDTDKRTLAEALVGADFLMGLSVADCVTPEMLLSMAKDPVVFAMSNPNPEINYELAVSTRSDLIMATGRSDYPNQINNVLGFPFIFRGALDVRASKITENMKMAAAKALAELTKQPVDDEVVKAYGRSFEFGREYIVPKPFDPRVIEYEAMAVAKAACEDGVARQPITDWEGYRKSLVKRMEKHWN